VDLRARAAVRSPRDLSAPPHTVERMSDSDTSSTSDRSDGNPTESRDSEFASQGSQAAQEDSGGGQTSPEHNEEVLGASRPDGGDPSLEKDPSEWVTGGDPITAAQKSYLDTLARQAGEELPADMTKGEASEHIERLRQKTGKES
jgi:hypothetical protein